MEMVRACVQIFPCYVWLGHTLLFFVPGSILQERPVLSSSLMDAHNNLCIILSLIQSLWLIMMSILGLQGLLAVTCKDVRVLKNSLLGNPNVFLRTPLGARLNLWWPQKIGGLRRSHQEQQTWWLRCCIILYYVENVVKPPTF